MKQRKLLFMLVLTLVLSTSIMFTACTPNIGGPSAEEIAAQKEAEEKKAALAPYVAFGKPSQLRIKKMAQSLKTCTKMLEMFI